MSIQILPARLANQIAAGEVVERPASVIKELVENSIDAGATQILVEVEQGGHKRILIRDNGKGIIKDELTLALSRHATSKIKDIDDLEAITSLGFRGEALASISSVSRLVLTSKPHNQDQAWQAHCEGRDMQIHLNPAAHPNGSSVEVLDLFFNTPARRKFLKAEKTEFQHIEETFKRIALSHSGIAFTLKHNGKIIHKLQSVDATLVHRRISQICGQAFVDNAVQIKGEYQDIEVTGWCNAIGNGRKTNDLQYSFINGRMIKDRVVQHAIRQAFEGMIDPQTFPMFVIFMRMPPDQLDINVHPAKHEVRFHQSRMVHDLLYRCVNDALVSAQTKLENPDGIDASLSTVSFEQTQQHDYSQLDRSQQSHNQERGYVSELSGALDSSEPRGFLTSTGAGRSTNTGSYSPPRQPSAQQNASYNALMSSSSQPSVDNTPAWLLTDDKRMVFVFGNIIKLLDIKVIAHSYFVDKLTSSDVTQPILMPVSIAVDNRTDVSALESLGFEIMLHGQKAILKKVPACMRQFPWLSIFPKLLDLLQNQNAPVTTSDTQRSQHLALWVSHIISCYVDVITLHPEQVSLWVESLSQDQLGSLIDEYAIDMQLPETASFGSNNA